MSREVMDLYESRRKADRRLGLYGLVLMLVAAVAIGHLGARPSNWFVLCAPVFCFGLMLASYSDPYRRSPQVPQRVHNYEGTLPRFGNIHSKALRPPEVYDQEKSSPGLDHLPEVTGHPAGGWTVSCSEGDFQTRSEVRYRTQNLAYTAYWKYHHHVTPL